MKDSKKKKYEIRGRQYRSLGVFAESDLLEKIHDGKFTGEEEIREVSEVEWQKLASHPRFYDAFLRRLFGAEYQAPSISERSHRPGMLTRHAGKEDGTRQLPEAGQEPEEHEPPVERTRQLPGKGGGNTIQQIDVDDLFSSGGTSKSKSKSKSRHTMMVPKEGDDEAGGGESPELPPVEAGPLSAPMQDGQVIASAGRLTEDEAPQFARRFKGYGRRKQFLIVGSCALILLGLMSLIDEPVQTLEADSEWETVRREALQESSAKEDKVRSLLDEADDWIRNDTELFYQGAAQVLVEAQSWDPQNLDVLTRLAYVQARALAIDKEPQAAVTKIQNLISQGRKLDPHSSALYRVEAILYLGLGDLEKSKEAALSAAETDPNSAENYLLVGELHYHSGALREARQVLADAVKTDPNNIRARYFLARTALELRELNVAQEQALEALKLNPLHPKSYFVLGKVAAAVGQFPEAKGLMETCARLARFTTLDVAAQAYFQLAELNERLGKKDDAQKAYRLAYFYTENPGSDLKAKTSGLDLNPKGLETLALETEFRSPYFADQGEGLIKQRKFKEALRFYQAAYILEPNNSKRLVDLGDATEKTADSYDDFRRVMVYYQRAIRHDPRAAEGYIKLGLLESEQYGFERAFKLLNQALLLDPESAAPHIALGKYFYKKQDVDESLNEFLKAAQLDPTNSEVLYYAGLLRLKFRKGGEKEAEGFFYKAYIADPKNTEALAAWLRLKASQHDRTFAIKFMNSLLEKDPESPDLHWVMGEIFTASSEYRKAVSHYHRALDLDNRSSRVRMSLAQALEAVGQLDRAVAEYRLAALLDRRNAEGFYRAADLLFKMRKYNQAEEVLNFLIGLAPTYPGAHEYLSRIHLVKKQDALAITAMEKEVANNPQNYKYILELAELYMQFQKFDNAIRELSKVTNLPSLKKAPEYRFEKVRAYLLLARCYRAQMKVDGAEGAIKLALELDPADPELQRELGYVYYAQQRDKEGAEVFEKYLKQNPNARDTATIKGMLQKMRIEQ